MRKIGIKRAWIVNQEILQNARSVMNSFLRIGRGIKDNGKGMYVMDMVFKFGQTVRNMKGIGKIIKLMVKASFGMCTEINMKEHGKEIKPTAMENILIATEPLMKVTGEMICNMATELNFGTTIQNMRAIIKEEKSMVKVHTHGRMAHNILERGTKIEFMETENTLGTTADNTRVIGKTTIWTAMVYILGKMEESMRVSTRKTKSMEKVYILGLMEENTTVNGRMVDSMEEANIYLKRDNSVKDYGKMERGRDGWTTWKINEFESRVRINLKY